MSIADAPQYHIPGNRDLDFDAPSGLHPFGTFRREWGTKCYSFDIGDVHFVTLDMVPADKLIVLSMHTFIYSFVDQNLARQMMDNVRRLYEILGCPFALDGDEIDPDSVLGSCERKVLALSGHTQTNEQIRPGETFRGWNLMLDSGALPPGRSVGAAPFPQIVAGASAGSWWSGDCDASVIPKSWQRLGAPRGFDILEFDGASYKDTFKATGKPVEQQMSADMLTPPFIAWYEALADWRNGDPDAGEAPPFNINDLPDTKTIPRDELGQTWLSVNVWNGSRDSVVYVQIDDREPVPLARTQGGEGELGDRGDGFNTTLDPYALKRQMQIARHAFISDSGDDGAQGFELFQSSQRDNSPSTPRPDSAFFWTTRSNHIWRVALPTDLANGVHTARIVTVDIHDQVFEETLAFEVVDARPPARFRSELFEARP